uniref:Uncharacterized protein n=1 Tax=Oryza nivara TaxID=4536 RepID=A0A0E0HSN0_ORYNI
MMLRGPGVGGGVSGSAPALGPQITGAPTPTPPPPPRRRSWSSSERKQSGGRPATRTDHMHHEIAAACRPRPLLPAKSRATRPPR